VSPDTSMTGARGAAPAPPIGCPAAGSRAARRGSGRGPGRPTGRGPGRLRPDGFGPPSAGVAGPAARDPRRADPRLARGRRPARRPHAKPQIRSAADAGPSPTAAQGSGSAPGRRAAAGACPAGGNPAGHARRSGGRIVSALRRWPACPGRPAAPVGRRLKGGGVAPGLPRGDPAGAVTPARRSRHRRRGPAGGRRPPRGGRPGRPVSVRITSPARSDSQRTKRARAAG